MNRHAKWILLLVFVLIGLGTLATAHAQGPIYGDRLIMGGRFTLRAGEIVRGDVVIFGGVADLQADSLVTGDVAIIGGTASIDGHVQGNISVVGGVLQLGPHAVVEGNAVEVGGQFDRDPSAIIQGDVIHSFDFGRRNLDGIEIPLPEDIPVPQPDFSPQQSNPMRGIFEFFFYLMTQGLTALAWAIVMAAFGLLLVILAPQHGMRARQTIVNRPLVNFAVGLLTILLLIPVFSALMITICLAPLAMALGLLILLASLLGWLTVGWELGHRVLEALHVDSTTPLTEALIGIVLLTLMWRLPMVIPFLGTLASWTVGIVFGCLGLGAIILSRFGTQVYPVPPKRKALVPLAPTPDE